MFIANTTQSANIILIFWKVGDNGINVMHFFVQDRKVGLNDGLKFLIDKV